MSQRCDDIFKIKRSTTAGSRFKTNSDGCSGSTVSISMSDLCGIDGLQNPFRVRGPFAFEPRVGRKNRPTLGCAAQPLAATPLTIFFHENRVFRQSYSWFL